MSRRQSKSSVPIGINEPVLGSVREESPLRVTGPTSIDIVRPTPVHVAPTHASMMSATHAVCLSSVGRDDELASRQYTGQYATVCTGLQVQTSAETLTAQSLLLLGRCPTSPQSSSHSSVQEWLKATGTHAPPASPIQSVSSSSSELRQVLAMRTEAPVVVPPSVRSSRVSRTSRVSRHSATSSLAMEIFGFAREMSGQTTQLVGQMQAQAQVYLSLIHI